MTFEYQLALQGLNVESTLGRFEECGVYSTFSSTVYTILYEYSNLLEFSSGFSKYAMMLGY